MTKLKYICKLCYKSFFDWKSNNRIYCSKDCHNKSKIGKPTWNKGIEPNKNSNWKGGRIISSYGYILIHKPSHPFSDHHGYVAEHRLVMEKHLGRYILPKEKVHHIDLEKNNNILENLHLFSSNSGHMKYHHFLRSCVREIKGVKI